MNKPTNFEQYLADHGELLYSIVGVSMLPLLRQDRDVVYIERKTPARCRPGDVALYRKNGRYILHRVVETREKDYVILGDNCVAKEYGVTDADVLGVMTAFTRGGKTYSVGNRRYKAYTRFLLATIGPRIARKKLWRRFRALGGRVLRSLGWRRKRP